MPVMTRCFAIAMTFLTLGHAARVAVHAEEFRVETEVFVGHQDEPIAENVTLFSSGLVYDFPLVGPEEITVFDPSRGRFVLLDGQRKVKTTLTTDELLKFAAAMKVQAHGMDGVVAFAANPRFEESLDEETGWLSLAGNVITYRAKCTIPKIPSAVLGYQEFADWYARLNATRPGALPPFARMELNRAVAQRQQVPEEVELVVEPKHRFVGRKLVVRSRHIFNWRLSNTDRKRIDKAGTWMAEFQPISFRDYRQSLQLADKP
jgi:hypothetical protein